VRTSVCKIYYLFGGFPSGNSVTEPLLVGNMAYWKRDGSLRRVANP
jgi:hypothetical protein